MVNTNSKGRFTEAALFLKKLSLGQTYIKIKIIPRDSFYFFMISYCKFYLYYIHIIY